MFASALPHTLIHVLQQRAAEEPERIALRFLAEGHEEGQVISYGELDCMAKAIAVSLQQEAGWGDRAVLLFPSGVDYVAAFFGCLYAGVIAVPAYPPESTRHQHQKRLLSIIADAQPRLLLTNTELHQPLLAAMESIPAASSAIEVPQLLCTDSVNMEQSADWQAPDIQPNDIAFLQYTSGSTAMPKGVQVTHHNLVTNEVLIRQGFGIKRDDVIVSWLPLYHDMGLIGGLLQAVYAGALCVLMSPRYFLARPVRWLQAISRYSGTVSGGPDFAYRMCVERVAESDLEALDLSSWQVAFSGSEPIRDDTLTSFCEKFTSCGFERQRYFACYGLAEATLFVTGSVRQQGVRTLPVDAAAFANNSIAEGVDSTVVGCGYKQPGHDVCLVDVQSQQPLADNIVGEIWASGPSIANGYWRNPEATAKTFVIKDGVTWLRTGDLGFMRDNELFVTGRLKDMLILRGQNLYPQDIERSVEDEVEVVRKGRVAAYAITYNGQECIGIAAEVGRKLQKLVPSEILIKAIREAVSVAHQEVPQQVVLLNPGALPKTSSGKLQRSACRLGIEDGSLDAYAIFPEQLSGQQSEKQSEQNAPVETASDNTATVVKAVWCELLKTDNVNSDDNFFLLGGNSVLAVQMAAQIGERFNIDIKLRLLFEMPTLTAFASAVKVLRESENNSVKTPAISPQSRERGLPLSPGQQRLWFLWQLDPQSVAYNIPAGLSLSGELNQQALQSAFEQLLQRHEALRTYFAEQEGQTLQFAKKTQSFELSVTDLSAMPISERENKAARLREEAANTVFDLCAGNLLRAQLIKLSQQEHQLLLTLHHVVADGWSLNVMMDELAQLYTAASQGDDISQVLAPLNLQYADYAAWQYQWLAEGGADQQLSYWQKQLGGEQPVLSLAGNQSNQSEPLCANNRAKRFSLDLDNKLVAGLKQLAQEKNATLFMVLLTAFQYLLYRYSGQNDIRIGVPSANRQRPEVQNLVGFFINTLVLRAEVNGSQTFTQLLAAARQTSLDAQMHQDMPIDRLVEVLSTDSVGRQNNPEESPLFQVIFNHQQLAVGAPQKMDGLNVEALPWHSREAKVQLQLQSEEYENGCLRLNFDYAQAYFDRETIQRMVAHFVSLLKHIYLRPEDAVVELPLLSEQEQSQLRQWSESTLASQSQVLLPSCLEQQVQQSPKLTALQWAGGNIQYCELNKQANRLAHYLQENGVGPEARVGILMPRSPQLMAGLLAVLKTGAAYVPLDPDYPAKRLAFMLEDSGAVMLLTESGSLKLPVFEHLPTQQQKAQQNKVVNVAVMDQLALHNYPTTAPELNGQLHADHLAYVIYTSGSTGFPKGVGISHGALIERLQWMQSAYQVTTDDVFLQKAAIGFDVSVWECFLPLISGAKLVLAAPGEQRDPRRLVELVRESKVTLLHFVPALMQLFIEEPSVVKCSSLRLLFSGGEALSPILRDRIFEQLPAVSLHNRYGPTETAINVTHWHCQLEDRARSPIGQPLGNVVCRVLDTNLHVLPAGIAGELCVGGVGLSRGYISKASAQRDGKGWAALTAERFIPDPEASQAGSRLYRTGDKVSWAADGSLDFFSRIDQQIKLRGFRIEPLEIQAQLLQNPAIKQAVVNLHKSDAGEQLVAYFVAEEKGGELLTAASELKNKLQQVLPDYMVPSQYISLDAIPLTANGKVNYRALPAPEATSSGQVDYMPPVTALEQQIAQIWQQVMGIGELGLRDDFFERGGHSLLATQIVSRTRLACNVELPLRVLFEHSELDDFAEQVRAAQAAGRLNSMPPIEIIDRHQPVPLSYSQQRYWFLWQMDPDSPAYNVGGMVRLRGPLHIEPFNAAMQALISRHEALRTTFPNVDGVPVQRVADKLAVELRQIDCSALAPEELQPQLQQLAKQEAHQPFDLEQGPLLRACLVQAAAQEHYLLLTLHHIVTEGWAMDIFSQELGFIYEAFIEGKPSPLEPLAVQYLDYSVWHRQWLEAGELQRQIDYWQTKLGDEQPLLELPSDRPRPPVQSHRGGLYRFDLADSLAEKVRAFNVEQGLTQFMTMTATLAVLLYRYSGQQDLRIGAPVANRIRPESEGLIGAFLNTQVLRCQLQGQMTVAELLAQVRSTVVEGQSNQDLPFDQLVDVLQPPRSTAYNPLFQVMCNIQRWDFQQSRELAGMQVDYMVNDAEATKFDLNLEVTDLNEQLSCCLTYSKDLFDEARIVRMASHWRNLLAAMISNPQQKICELPLFSEDKLREQLLSLNPQLAALPDDQTKTATEVQAQQCLPRCVHEIFAEQAAASPAAPALTFAGQTLSYGELESRANQFARCLREQGVGPEVSVGLAMERSLEMVIGLLAILKAGGAYVPLDPEYPLERLQGMIADSCIKLLLGHQALFTVLGELPAGVKRWCVEQDSAQLQAYSDAAITAINHPHHQAYLIYTSGSTGVPKGVMVSHGEISRHCQAVIKRFDMHSDDCELHFYSINFDAATERLLTPLLCGGRVVLRGQGQWGAEEICHIIREQGVTTLGFTPSYGSQLAQWLMARGEQLPVRICITGGEALTAEHLQRIRDGFQPQYFFNAYGPTETVVMPLASAAPQQLLGHAPSVPIGHIVGDRVAYILDQDLALVPQGSVGELYIGGAGLARGYHLRAGVSAERFMPDPFTVSVAAEGEGGRLYRTGDLVRQLADGQVEYVGRTDYQVKLRGYRIELGEIEARILQHPNVDETVVMAMDMVGGKQLVGYIVASGVMAASEQGAGDKQRLREELQNQLKAQLPDYMVPTQLILLAKLPLSPNGKLDRKALPSPDPEHNRQAYIAPRDEWEQGLAEIWCDVLGVEQVGIHDNFFELGGDSILSIQVVSRARQIGLHFTPRELFQHQSVQTLALAATQLAEADGVSSDFNTEQGIVEGQSLLTPIQHWFLSLPVPNVAHWNQAVLLEPVEPLNKELLTKVLQHLLNQHDALRLRFAQNNGEWQAQHSAKADAKNNVLTAIEVSDFSEALQYFEAAQSRLDLEQGPLLRAVLVGGPQQKQRLLLLAHHLVVDGVSWRILLADLQQFYRQLSAGATLTLAAKTSAFRDWSSRLQAYAKGESLRETLAWWQNQLGDKANDLPCDFPAGENLECHAKTVSLSLDAQRTQQLLQQAPAAYRTQVNDLLLTALARVLCRWMETESVLVQLEGHGREALFNDIDLTRTVGWFTSAYPLRLTPGLLGAKEQSSANAIKAIKEQLRAVPHRGIEYGVLRYLTDDGIKSAMAALPQAAITFNYLGQFDQSFGNDALFRPLEDSTGSNHDQGAPLPNDLTVDGQVYQNQLQLRWTYSSERYQEITIKALAEAYIAELGALIAHCVSGDEAVKGFTPSDFPLAELGQQQLDAVTVPVSEIEDIYPLTPMQEGLLLHTLLEPGTGIYYMQDRYQINSAIDAQRFALAWQKVVARHESLRASFSWNAGEVMQQVIHKSAAVEMDFLDWRQKDKGGHEARLQALLKIERETGFDLLNKPPFHLRLIRLEDQRYWFMMSNHHILIDAWCRSILMNDFFEIYTALSEAREPQLSVPPRYRDYIVWLQQQDRQQAHQWWQQNLQGFEQVTAIASDRPLLREHAGDSGGMIVGDCFTSLDAEEGLRLQRLAQSHQLTLNTFAQAAWALVLRRLSGDRDVLFGVTVAGRPIEMPEMQRTVGLFINSIPLRVPMPAAGENCLVGDWLQNLLEHNLALREYEYLSLVEIQGCSDLHQGDPLFDSLFVFENAPVDSSVLESAKDFNASSDSGRTHTNFPLTAVCYPGDELGLHISFDQRYFDHTTIEAMLGEFKRLLLALGDYFEKPLAELPLLSDQEQQFLIENCNAARRQNEEVYQGYVQRFEARVKAHPQRIAASCMDQQWTYEALDQRANRLGHQLVIHRLAIQRPVALLAERGLNLLGMMIGTFKAGAAYLPLDPDYPVKRMATMMRSSQVKVVVCDHNSLVLAQTLLEQFPCANRPSLLLWEEVQQGGDSAASAITSGAKDLAYVIYTSGSTGEPKGVMVEQQGMLNNQLSKVPYLQLSDKDVIAQTASQCFDISVWQFLTAPLFGGRVDIVPNTISQDPRALLEHIQGQNISVLESVPSLIQGMLDEEPQALACLRWLLPTGEAMPPALARRWLERYPAIRLVNAYGPAECSDDVALFNIDLESTEASYLPIGSPTTGNSLYLLDDELSLVPIGATADLCVTGIGVGRGYMNDPQRTALAFVPDPFSAKGERLYRSGDLAKRDSDGLLSYVGRIDQQVKIRGFRIELGEIEARLNRMTSVNEAAVLVQQEATGSHLVAYIVAADIEDAVAVNHGDYSIVQRLKASLQHELPEYMVPLHWQVLEQMPRNANGKLDRKALPKIDIGQQRRVQYLAPRNELEQTLANIWSELLKVEQVGVRDNFFELGGHSLIATQIASRVQTVLQRNVPLRAMFECVTVEALATYIDSLETEEMSEEKVNRLDDLMAQLEGL